MVKDTSGGLPKVGVEEEFRTRGCQDRADQRLASLM